MFCLKEGNIFRNGPQNLAVVNDFYCLNDLSDAEIAFLRAFAERLPDRNHEVISNFISMFTLHSKAARLLRPEMEEYQEILKAIDIHKSNLEENFHAAFEGATLSILDEVRNGDLSFYQDIKRCPGFMHFVALQILRTKKLADAMKAMPLNNFGVDIEKVWPVQRHMTAANLGCNLFMERTYKPITLVRNDTEVHFVTSDQPVINLYGGEFQSNVLAVYYPVSPTRSIIFGDLKNDVPRPEWVVSPEDAHRLNLLMKAASHEMVFGDSEAILRTIV
jgi:hypothetical protein